MSRIGQKAIAIPEKTQVRLENGKVCVEGPKGKLDFLIPVRVKVEVVGKEVLVRRDENSKQTKALHGLTRSLVNNMIKGVSVGFMKELEINGIGYRAQVEGKKLVLFLGFTHPVQVQIPEGIVIETPKPNQVFVKGIDKAKVGEVAATIRSFYPPEPYKGKGIRYIDEQIRRKAGKAAATTSK